MGRWARVYFDDDLNDGNGCFGCLGLIVGLLVLSFVCSFGGRIYTRYTDWRIDSRRVRVTPETLDLYVGQYDYNKRYRIVIERRGDNLFNKSPEESCELMPVSETDFLYRNCANGFRGRARFIKDAQGKMIMVIFHQNGDEERAARK